MVSDQKLIFHLSLDIFHFPFVLLHLIGCQMNQSLRSFKMANDKCQMTDGKWS
jgi:hypothetical protein